MKKRILILTVAMGLILISIPIIFEPEIVSSAEATGEAAVTLTVDEGISLTVPSSNLALNQPGNMSATVNTVTNAAAGASWNVKTNSQDGWKLELNASGDNCLTTGSESFTDYTEASTGTPDAWSVTNAYEFGFNVEGTYITSGTGKWGTGTDCATQANKKYMGFEGSTKINVGTNSSETNQSGEDIIMCVAAEQDTVYAPSGSYSCTVTGTATSNQ